MNKRIITAICVILAIVLLIPIPLSLKDGGTIVYQAILYRVTDMHSYATVDEYNITYNDGIIIEILGIEVFNNVKEIDSE